jgi:hypothetical protein
VLFRSFQLLLRGNPPYGDPLSFLVAAVVFLLVSILATAALGRAVLARSA